MTYQPADYINRLRFHAARNLKNRGFYTDDCLLEDINTLLCEHDRMRTALTEIREHLLAGQPIGTLLAETWRTSPPEVRPPAKLAVQIRGTWEDRKKTYDAACDEVGTFIMNNTSTGEQGNILLLKVTKHVWAHRKDGRSFAEVHIQCGHPLAGEEKPDAAG